MDPSLQVRPDGTFARPKGYFERNWKWLAAVAVLGSLLLFTLFVGGIFLAIFGSMKSSDAYKMAVAKAKANPEVIAALGTPIEEGWFITGNISVNGPSGNAELSIPLQGPNAKGTIFLEAKKSAGQWTFSLLEVEVPGREARIDLLAAPPET